MVGLRTQESSKFQQFFSLVQAQAKQMGFVFFLDCGEGRELETDSLSCEDLSGWLIPEQQANDFNLEFEAGDVSDRWGSHICFALWQKTNDTIQISFQKY